MKGKITYEETLEAFRLMTSEGGTFFNFMEKAVETTTGKWSVFKDELIGFGRAIGKFLLPPINQALGALTINDKVLVQIIIFTLNSGTAPYIDIVDGADVSITGGAQQITATGIYEFTISGTTVGYNQGQWFFMSTINEFDQAGSFGADFVTQFDGKMLFKKRK